MKFNLKAVLVLFLSLLILTPAESFSASSIVKKRTTTAAKSKKSKKKKTTRKYSKKRTKRSTRKKKGILSSKLFYVPTNYAVYGIDVSKYQGLINWGKLGAPSTHKFNINFAFIKATEGGDRKDPRFDMNWQNAATNGVKRGAYHFYRPNSDPYLQAQNFISSVRLTSGDLPPVIDVEKRGIMSEERFQRDLKTFTVLLEKAYGVKPIFYTGAKFHQKHLSNQNFDGYPFWIAHYGKKDIQFKKDWKFWQFTDKAQVNGIKNKVDMNVFKGTVADLEAMCLK